LQENGNDDIAELAITETPRSHSERRPQRDATAMDPQSQALCQFLSALMHSGLSFAYRISSLHDAPRVSYLTKTPASTVETLRAAFACHFPEFRTSCDIHHHTRYASENIHLALVRGLPRQTPGSLNGLVRFMLDSGSPSIYQVWTTSEHPSWADRYLAGKRYSSGLSRVQRHDSARSWIGGNQTVVKVDAVAQAATERLAAAYRRMNSDRVLDCRILLGFWDGEQCEVDLRDSLSVLLGAISREDRHERMRYTLLSGQAAERTLNAALRLDMRIRGTKMLPMEAVPLFEIPTVDFGVRQGSPASFTTWSPTSETGTLHENSIPFVRGMIALGRVLRDGGPTAQVRYLDLESLRKHTTIIGATGSGKTTTKNRIVIDAWRNGIPSLLIEPAKTDARALMAAIPELRVFTVGREQVAPFRQNPFDVEEGVPVQLHIDNLHMCFNSSWPVYGILSNHLRRVLLLSYRSNGWDELRDVRGELITPEDFLAQAQEYGSRLPYANELRQNFTGAIMTRAEELCEPSRAAIFNSRYNLSMSELLSVPTVIELCHIGDRDFRAFLLSLLLTRVCEHFYTLGPAKSLRSLLVIDEAHSVLEELPRVTDPEATSSSRRKAVDQQVDLVAESRGPGLGVIIADQNAMRLSRDALKICQMKAVHRTTSPEDRELLALETGCNEEQRAHIDVLRPGEIVMRGPSDSVPSNVQVFHDPDFIPEMLREWTDKDVIDRMRTFYEQHEEFARTPDIPVVSWTRTISEEKTVALAVQIEDIVSDEVYTENYSVCTRDPEAESKRLIERLAVHYACSLSSGEEDLLDVARTILDLTGVMHGAPPYEPDIDVMREMIQSAQENRAKKTTGRGGSDEARQTSQ